MWRSEWSNAATTIGAGPGGLPPQPPLGDMSYEMYMPGQTFLYQRCGAGADASVPTVVAGKRPVPADVHTPATVANASMHLAKSSHALSLHSSSSKERRRRQRQRRRLQEHQELDTAMVHGRRQSTPTTPSSNDTYHRPMHVLEAPRALLGSFQDRVAPALPMSESKSTLLPTQPLFANDSKPTHPPTQAVSSPSPDGAVRPTKITAVSAPAAVKSCSSPPVSAPPPPLPTGTTATGLTPQRVPALHSNNALAVSHQQQKPPSLTQSRRRATPVRKLSPKTARAVRTVAIHITIALVTAAAVFVMLLLLNPSFVQQNASKTDGLDEAAAHMRAPADVTKAAALSVFAGVAAAALPHAWKALKPYVGSAGKLW